MGREGRGKVGHWSLDSLEVQADVLSMTCGCLAPHLPTHDHKPCAAGLTPHWLLLNVLQLTRHNSGSVFLKNQYTFKFVLQE